MRSTGTICSPRDGSDAGLDRRNGSEAAKPPASWWLVHLRIFDRALLNLDELRQLGETGSWSERQLDRQAPQNGHQLRQIR